MMGKLYTFIGCHKNTQRKTRRGVRILAILALTFVMVGANPSSSAQAAPAREGFTYVMTAVPSTEYICVGQTMDINVKISLLLVSQPGDTGPKFGDIHGVTPNVNPIDPSVGTIAISGTLLNPTNLQVETTIFTFRASKNPGTTTIQFYADIPPYWNGDEANYAISVGYHVKRDLQIEVRNCKYSVEIYFNSTVAGLVNWFGTNETTSMQAETDTHFTNLTGYQITEHWLFDTNEVGCDLTAAAAPTEVSFSGDLVNESFYLTFTIQKATMNRAAGGGNNCGFSFSADFPGSTTTVKFPSQGGVRFVPAGTNGGYLIILTRY